MSHTLVCLGHPLLDIQVRDAQILHKYQLKANDAILAEEKHMPLYDEIVKHQQVTYVAGGAAQNAARAAAYILPPNSVLFTGCVGNDDLAEQLRVANHREGLDEAYQIKAEEKTGACAVIISGHNRSLVSTLRAARKFDISHFSSPAVAPSINSAKVYYVEGYFLSHGADCVLELGQKAATSGKIFTLNFAAPYITRHFNNEVQRILPFCDIVIGNEAEAEAYATANSFLNPKDLPSIAKSIALLPKANPSKPRIVAFTQGAASTIYVTSASPDSPRVIPVHALTDGEIIDTNGAGDAFAGGFLAAYILGKELDECVEIGHKMGSMCIQEIGPQFKWPKVKIVDP